MNQSVQYFDVSPLTVRADEISEVRIRPRYEQAAFPPAERVRVAVVPGLGALPDGRQLDFSWEKTSDPFELVDWKLHEDGSLFVRARFAGEQEHIIIVEDTDGNLLREFSVYSLLPDWYGLLPFKGDFHVHTLRSDGKESPAYVAARYREAGFDFLAISDHHRYEPSLEAIDYWRRHPTGLTLLPGEEVHPPECPVHMLNFGGRFSVNALFREDEAKFRREVEARIPSLGPVASGVNPFAVAATEWVFDKVREAGGLAVFCHPYWDVRRRNVLSGALVDEVFKRRKFDALELIGGFWKHQSESNALQVARWMEERAAGADYPVVGLSDSHGTDVGGLFGWYYTVVLARSASFDDLAAGIRAGNSAAVDAPENERPHCHGSCRLSRYMHFLLREYFPRHEALCRTEGELMLAILGGEPGLSPVLELLAKRPAAFRERVLGGAEGK